MDFYVYVYAVQGEPFYVGKGCDGRAWSHLKRTHNEHLQRRIKKLLREGIVPEIDVYPCVSEVEAYATEQFLIKAMGRRDLGTGPLLNHTDGGVGGSVVSAETRAKMSASHRGKKQSPEHIANKAAARRGKQVSNETREKIAQANRGRKHPPDEVARRANSMRGNRNTLGHKLSAEHKANIAAGLARRKETLAESSEGTTIQ